MKLFARWRARKEADRAARAKAAIAIQRACNDFLNGKISASEFLNSEYDPRYRT